MSNQKVWDKSEGPATSVISEQNLLQTGSMLEVFFPQWQTNWCIIYHDKRIIELQVFGFEAV